MDLIDNLLRHKYQRPVLAVDSAPCVKADEVVTSLRVPSGACGNSANSARCHGIVVLLVRLHTFAKFNFAVGVEVKHAIQNNLSRALSR